MKLSPLLSSLALCVCTPSTLLHAETVTETETIARDRIEDRMSPDTFSAAGLTKLSPEELEVLNRWLYGVIETERRVAVEEAVPRGEESFGLEDVTEKVMGFFLDTPDVINSRVVGDFEGWSGKTVFELENGQVWKQVEPGKFRYPGKREENPVLNIRKAFLGSYLLKVEGMGTTVRVKRIR